VHQAYIADIEASSNEALASVDPVPYYMHYGENVWAGVKAHLDAVTERAAAPIVAKYTGVLAAADIDVFTRTTTFAILQSLRLDRGPSGPVHPWPEFPRADGQLGEAWMATLRAAVHKHVGDAADRPVCPRCCHRRA
jgi:hypothetical protein